MIYLNKLDRQIRTNRHTHMHFTPIALPQRLHRERSDSSGPKAKINTSRRHACQMPYPVQRRPRSCRSNVPVQQQAARTHRQKDQRHRVPEIKRKEC